YPSAVAFGRGEAMRGERLLDEASALRGVRFLEIDTFEHVVEAQPSLEACGKGVHTERRRRRWWDRLGDRRDLVRSRSFGRGPSGPSAERGSGSGGQAAERFLREAPGGPQGARVVDVGGPW